MRLSHGFVRGEVLSCIYHGWSYAQAGNCLRIPAHPGLIPPETIRVATQRVEESGGVIWVAVGEPVDAPPRFQGLLPLRSLTADAGIAAIEAAAGEKRSADGLLRIARHSKEMWLLLVAQAQAETLIHVLVNDDATPCERILASRAAETVRRMAEDVETKGIA